MSSFWDANRKLTSKANPPFSPSTTKLRSWKPKSASFSHLFFCLFFFSFLELWKTLRQTHLKVANYCLRNIKDMVKILSTESVKEKTRSSPYSVITEQLILFCCILKLLVCVIGMCYGSPNSICHEVVLWDVRLSLFVVLLASHSV